MVVSGARASLCALLVVAAAAASAGGAEQHLHVCCGCGSDASQTPWLRAAPLNSLAEALSRAQQLRGDGSAAAARPLTIFIAGRCAPPRRALTAADGGAGEASRVTWRSYPGEDPAVISGGVPLPAAALEPVTDPDVAAQIQPAALPFVRQVDLAAIGVSDLGAPQCHPYMGGEASILPGNLVSAALELHLFGDDTIGGDLSPLTLARWPNKDHLPKQWANGTVSGYEIAVDALTAARLPFWAQQLREDAGSIFAHYLGGLGWNDHVNALANVNVALGGAAAGPPSITLAACPSHYEQPGFDALDNAGTFYTYNILYELDSEGEFYVNRTSRMLYVWPPAAQASPYWQVSPWGKPVVAPITAPRGIERARARQLRAGAGAGTIGELSIDADLLLLDGTSFLSLDGLVLTSARNAGVRAINTTAVLIQNCILENFGSMAVNASGGSAFAIDGSVVRHAGNGAVYFYAGERATLTPARHSIRNSSVSYSNRYLYCYVPSVALADCGNTISDSELFGGPHQGTFISGNDHEISRSVLHDLVEAASDSGVVYMGRDWSYQGNAIVNNTFLRINTADPGDDVSAVYLDDMISGFNITGNVFVNVSRALLLGGGRSNVFANNSITGVDGGDGAVHFDDRGLGWDAGACAQPDGEMVRFLARVPYNTSAVWIARFPQLATILEDAPCTPKYNAVVGNTFCSLGASPFIDASNASIASWGSTAWGNVQQC